MDVFCFFLKQFIVASKLFVMYTTPLPLRIPYCLFLSQSLLFHFLNDKIIFPANFCSINSVLTNPRVGVVSAHKHLFIKARK